jgi:hypothetical protein
MSDHNVGESGFGSNIVDAGLGTDNDEDESADDADDDREEIEPEYPRMTREEAMAVGNSDDGDVDEE